MSATLRALAGLPTEPVSLAESALILIDCQNTYTRGPMELVGVQAALDQAAELLDRARSAGIPIVHIQHDDGEGSLYDVRGESGAIVDRWRPATASRSSSRNTRTRSWAPTCTSASPAARRTWCSRAS